MNSKHTFIAMVVFCVVSVGLLGASVFFGNQLLQSHSKKLTDLKVEAAVTDAQQTALTQAKKDIETYEELNNIAKQIVPQDKDQARAVREIVTIAAQSGISITGITFPASNLGQAQPKATTTEDDKEGDSETKKTTAPAISQVKPVDGIKGVYQLELNVTTDSSQLISYAQLIDFLQRLEQNRRTAQITNLSIQPNPSDRNLLTLNMQLMIYIKP
ncbi:hypothetical protein E6P97_02000 [Patescibacteria group bacterium]|nr:MAG: hypothetical protein E6P97_02000 [Patescibacteria group bacterium]